MECVLVWLAVMAAAFHMAQAQQNCTNNGRVRVRGIDTEEFKAGRVEICANNEWRAVCHDGWDEQAAILVCQQLFPGGYVAVWCNNSCLGGGGRTGVDIQNCTATGKEDILSCDIQPLNSSCGNNHSGVVCCRDNSTCLIPEPTPPSECDVCNTTCPTPPTPLTQVTPVTPETPVIPGPFTCSCPVPANTDPNGMTEESTTADLMRESCPSLAALGGGLGALTAILAILLVGVVIGWVWSCRRMKEKAFTDAYSNPTYSPTFFSNNHTSTLESSNSLGRTPTNPFHPDIAMSLPAHSVGNKNTAAHSKEEEVQPISPPDQSVVNNKKASRPAEGSERKAPPLYPPGYANTLPRPAGERATQPRLYSVENRKAPRTVDEKELRPISPLAYSVVDMKKALHPAGKTEGVYSAVNKKKALHPAGKTDHPATPHIYSAVNKKKAPHPAGKTEREDQPATPHVYSAVNKKKVEARPISPPLYSVVNKKKAPPHTEENERLYHVLEGPARGGEGDYGEDERQYRVFGEQGRVEEAIYEESVYLGPGP